LSSLTTSTKFAIFKSLPKLVPPLQLSLLETPSFMPTRNPKFFQSGNPKFPCEVKTKFFWQTNQNLLHPNPHNFFYEFMLSLHLTARMKFNQLWCTISLRCCFLVVVQFCCYCRCLIQLSASHFT
jgi:hypothetical protein